MVKNSSPFKILTIMTMLVLVILVYAWVIQPWFLKWGATDEEIRGLWPGDDLIPGSSIVYTRAITIKAAPSEIWPWLVQIGQGRGGFYTYELLENMLSADIHNTNRIVPEWQQLKVGDKVMMGPKEGVWGNAFDIVGEIVPGTSLVLITPGKSQTRVAPIRGNGTWAFILVPVDEKTSRLIIRGRRMESRDQAINLLYGSVIDSAQFIMERKMMMGIKERVEGTIQSQIDDIVQVLLWMVALVGLILAMVLVVVQKKWKWPLIVALAALFIFWFLCFLQPPIVQGIVLDSAILLALARVIWASFST